MDFVNSTASLYREAQRARDVILKEPHDEVPFMMTGGWAGMGVEGAVSLFTYRTNVFCVVFNIHSTGGYYLRYC